MAAGDNTLPTLYNGTSGAIYGGPNGYYSDPLGQNALSKDAFYSLTSRAADPTLANTFSNNPYGISYQELQSLFGGATATAPTSTDSTTVAPTSAPATGGTALPDYSQQIAQYQNSINNLLPTQLNAGNQNIENSYQSALQQLLQGKNVADRNYGTSKQQAATGYVGAKNTIGSQAGSALNGLLRLLGSRGAGASSAADAARSAVTRGAGLQRADVGTTFGQNNQALDTNYGDYINNYNQSVSGAGTQRDAAKQSLQNQIDTSRAGLLQSIAGLQSSPANAQPYLNQANDISQRVASYVPPQVNYNPVAYQAPSLSSYTTNPQATPTYSNQSGGNDYFSPYLQQLLGKKQQVA